MRLTFQQCQRTGRRVAYALALLAALTGLGVRTGPAKSAPPTEADARKTEAQLQAVKGEIDRITREVSEEQVERDRLTRDLRSAEISVGKAREGLDEVRRSRAQTSSQRAVLAGQKRAREEDLARNRSALAGQLRAAYLTGPQEPFKLLLSQTDPERVERMLRYYSYFGRARAEQIRVIADDLETISHLDDELASKDQQLSGLEQTQRAQLSDLEQARAHRSEVLASVTAESNSREQSLERLKAQQGGLEKLLSELRRAIARLPVDANDAFARLRGKLAWPVGGRLLAQFGESRAGGLKWDGVLVGTERGAPVKAVYRGRVIYADWLPGLGLLTIVDHGDGYMSLYGHNERLYKAAGELVNAGDTLGSAGDSGGSSRPELYFEIRKGGKAVDPRPWFRSSQP